MYESSTTIDSATIASVEAAVVGGGDNQVKVLDRRLREYAKRRSELDAAEAFDLLQAERLRVYAMFGCATHFEYMERRLGYAPHTARERMRVARALAKLPNTTVAMAKGECGYSAARALTRVVTPSTEEVWLARVNGMTARQIEEMAAGLRPGDLPDDPKRPDLRPKVVRLVLPPEVFALLRQARAALADERGGEVTDADLIETMCRRLLDPGTGEGGPAHQIAYKQCLDCLRATQNGAGREIDIAEHVLERAECDARHLGSLDASAPQRATSSVTPRIREQVFARDNHRCTVPGCRSSRNLDIHHILEQSRGGKHELMNLTLACSGHHAALHAGLLEISGQAPYGLHFRWTIGAPLPPGLDPEQREAMIEQRVGEILRAAAITIGEPDEPTERDVPRGTRATRQHGHVLDGDVPRGTRAPRSLDPDAPRAAPATLDGAGPTRAPRPLGDADIPIAAAAAQLDAVTTDALRESSVMRQLDKETDGVPRGTSPRRPPGEASESPTRDRVRRSRRSRDE